MKLLKHQPHKVTEVHASQSHDLAKRIEGKRLQNEPPCQRRLKEKHMMRNFGSSSGRTFSGEFQLI
jgi:hypothetical protein